MSGRDFRAAVPLIVLGVLLAVSSATGGLASGGFPTSGAIFVDTSIADGTVTAGSWSTTRYLQNRPSPPTGDTTAQVDLPAGFASPVATTLYNLASDCDGKPGRRLFRGDALPTESDPCRYVNWRLDPVVEDTELVGTVQATIWAAKSNPQGRIPTLVAYLRAWDGTEYTELASASAALDSTDFEPITFAFTVDTTLPAGQALELKLVVDGFNRNVTIAYDTVDHPSSITLP